MGKNIDIDDLIVKFTPQQIKAYIQSTLEGKIICPYCGASVMKMTEIKGNEPYFVFLLGSCCTCDGAWQARYQLTGIKCLAVPKGFIKEPKD